MLKFDEMYTRPAAAGQSQSQGGGQGSSQSQGGRPQQRRGNTTAPTPSGWRARAASS